MRSRKRSSNSSFFTEYSKEENSYSSPYKKNNSRDGPLMGNFDPKYPESISAFADGLRSDVMEIIGTGAGILNKSINFIFPFIGYDSVDTNENDSLHDIEVINSNTTTTIGTGISTSTTTNKNNKNKDQKMKQSQDALRMRCQSLWGKDNNNINEQQQQQSNGSQSYAQKGGKVLLDKLNKNPSIQVSYIL